MPKGMCVFHHDAGHGWFELPMADVTASGAAISVFSYKRGKAAYLEEDSDMSRFIDAIGGQSAFAQRATRWSKSTTATRVPSASTRATDEQT